MSDADCTFGREPRSVAASFLECVDVVGWQEGHPSCKNYLCHLSPNVLFFERVEELWRGTGWLGWPGEEPVFYWYLDKSSFEASKNQCSEHCFHASNMHGLWAVLHSRYAVIEVWHIQAYRLFRVIGKYRELSGKFYSGWKVPGLVKTNHIMCHAVSC